MGGQRRDGGIWDAEHRRATGGLLTLVTLIAFEAMAVGTAMPAVVDELDALAWYAWPFSAFLVASVVGMVLGGMAGDRGRTRAALPAGVAAFATGLLIAGVAQHMAVLVAGRAVQGFGAGVMATLLYVIAGQAYEARLRPRLFGAISAAWVLPALIGPVVSGLVTQHLSWRLVFLGLLPLVAAGLLLLVASGRRAPVPAVQAPAGSVGAGSPRGEGSVPLADGRTTTGAGRRDVRAWWALLAGLGIAALQYAGQRLDLIAIAVAVAGVAVLAAGLRPLLPRGTARAVRGIPAVVASRALLAGAFFGMDALLPLTLTAIHGFSPAAAGLPLTAGAIGWAAASQLQGRRPDVPRERVLRAGFALLTLGLAGTLLAAVPAFGGWPAYLSWAVAGLGMGLGMPSVGVLLLDQSPEAERGANSAALQIGDVTASALCVGLGGVLVGAATAGVLTMPWAIGTAIVTLTAVAAAGVRVAGRTASALGTASSRAATTLAAS
jgi:MFS family permease